MDDEFYDFNDLINENFDKGTIERFVEESQQRNDAIINFLEEEGSSKTKNSTEIKNNNIYNNITSLPSKENISDLKKDNNNIYNIKDNLSNNLFNSDTAISDSRIKDGDYWANMHLSASLSAPCWFLSEFSIKRYKEEGISELYSDQFDCLSISSVRHGGNLLYTAPTSSGKTLVAEMLIVQSFTRKKKKILFILPYLAIVSEKGRYYQKIFGRLNKQHGYSTAASGVRFRIFLSSESAITLSNNVDVAVCTIEKANILINNLIMNDSLSILGAVVVDELHMIDKVERGYILETLLSKIMFLSSSYSDPIQIIGLSATLPQIKDISNWLNATLFSSSYRPVPLKQYLVKDFSIFEYSKDTEIVNHSLKKIPKYTISDIKIHTPHNNDTSIEYKVIALVASFMIKSESILIFCATKEKTESVCRMLTINIISFIKKNLEKNFEFNLTTKNDRNRLLSRLSAFPLEIFSSSIPLGIAYHHAGLTLEERSIIETAFSSHVLRVLTCTSTLAAGVNLPADRVIFYDMNVGINPLSVAEYHQMAGRAGRTKKGNDSLYYGSSFLLTNSNEMIRHAEELLTSPLPPIRSALSKSISRLILEAIASFIVKDISDLHSLFHFTLYYIQIENEKKNKLKIATDSRAEATKIIKKYNNICLIGNEESIKEIEKKKNVAEKIALRDEKLLKISREKYNKDITESINTLIKDNFIEVNEDKYFPTKLGVATFVSGLPPSDAHILFEHLARAMDTSIVLSPRLYILTLFVPFKNEMAFNRDKLIRFHERIKEWKRYSSIKDNSNLSILSTKCLEIAFKCNIEIERIDTWLHMTPLHIDIGYSRFYIAWCLYLILLDIPPSLIAKDYYLHRGTIQELRRETEIYGRMITRFLEFMNWNELAILVSECCDSLSIETSKRLSILNSYSIPISVIKVIEAAGIKSLDGLSKLHIESLYHILKFGGPFDFIKSNESSVDVNSELKFQTDGWIDGIFFIII